MKTQAMIAQCGQPSGEGGESQDAGAGLLTMLPPIILMVLVFYFLLIRPQRKKEKERQEMIGKLKKNEKIVTHGGIYGTVVTIKDPWIIIKIDDNSETRMKILRTSVAGLADGFEAEEGKKAEEGKNKEKEDKK